MRFWIVLAALAALPVTALGQGRGNPSATPQTPAFSANPWADPWRPLLPPPGDRPASTTSPSAVYRGYPALSPDVPDPEPFGPSPWRR